MRTNRRNLVICLVIAAPVSAAWAALATNSGDSQLGTRAVINEQFIEVLNSDVLLRLWEQEVEGGLIAPFYSIALDGRTFSRPRQTNYLIKLRFAYFDPAIGTPAVPAAFQADSESELYIVQFVTQPVEAMRQALRDRGATVWTYLASHAHIVKMSTAVRDAVERFPFVRWVGPMHPAYKLEEEIIEQILADDFVAGRRYSIMLYERGAAAQERVMAEITANGGQVHGNTPLGYRIEADMTLDQVLATASLDDVMFIDRKGEIETDMDIAREIGGANFIESTLGFTGQGVRGEVADTEIDVNHVEWSAPPIIHRAGSTSPHGTSVYGILFARGANPQARGLIPDGVGIFAYSIDLLGGGQTRYQHTAELVDPNGPYRAVFQTNSTGDLRTFLYTTISAEMDDMLLINDIIICQSQSNAGNQDSRPQAWAKNIVSGGGFLHQNTLPRTDDTWSFTASIGPAADGRVKPTLAAFYDGIFTTTAGGGYTQFGGTSGATPIIAGHFGLMFQMWHEEVFPGFGGGEDVFDSRPHMSTAKALLVNTAFRYDWTAGGPNADMDRFKQGWGNPNVEDLYEYRDRIFIVNETEVLTELSSSQHDITVLPDEPLFRVTLVYSDPRGNVGGNEHRINDLSLRVTSPSGEEYWGNNGLLDGNVSTPGGQSNTIDTVENVFIADPEPGVWQIEVIADEINGDSHAETPEIDADFALVVTGGEDNPRAFTIARLSGPIGLLPRGSTGHVEVEIVPLAENILPGSETLFYRFDQGSFRAVPLIAQGKNLYAADLPAAFCLDAPEYYFQAESDGGTVITAPEKAPDELFSYAIGESVEFHSDNFEEDNGWTTENLGATSGDFDRGVPVNDPKWPFDPISDSDGSGKCWLTENEFGNTDVDEGAVALISPIFDLSQGGITITYDYFLRMNNAAGTDRMRVQILDTTGPPAWIEIASHGTDGGLEWRTHRITQADLDIAGVVLSNAMQIRFTVNDAEPQSFVEGALDAFKLGQRGCDPVARKGDLNCDFAINALDIEPFILALFNPAQYAIEYPDCDITLGDINEDGVVDALDIEPFLNLLFQ